MPRHTDSQNSPAPDNTACENTSAGEKFVYLIRQLFTVVIIPGIIIAGGVIGAKKLIDSGPKAERRERKHLQRLGQSVQEAAGCTWSWTW